jgi:hypothetical protein
MSEDMETCDRCGVDRPDGMVRDKTLVDDWRLCDACIIRLNDLVRDYKWKDRYTEEQHERAMSVIGEQEEIECVIGSYDVGQIYIHTPYVSSDVVADFCNHFGLKIHGFGPRWEKNEHWPCMKDHGDTFEVLLQYDSKSRPPNSLGTKFNRNHINDLLESDKQF